MKIAWETLVAAVLVAACIVFIGRYQISAIGSGDIPVVYGKEIYRLDRWTGEVAICKETTRMNAPNVVECPEPEPPVQRTN